MPTTRNGSSPKVAKSRTARRKSPGPEDVALRAYQIYLERGGAPGNELDDWTRAERELLATNGKPSRKPKSKSKSMAA